MRLVFDEVLAALRGQIRGEAPRASIAAYATDTRDLPAESLYFALRGDRFDGHDFVGQALERGALAAVVEVGQAERVRSASPVAGEAGRLIEVEDVVAALGRLAAYHRSQAPATVIAVVGSNGKTTTKSMIDHILGGRLRGRASPKSYNNAIGVPLTLLSSEQGDDYLVVEIGTNSRGEISQLARIAEPDMAVVTSIGAEHLAGLGDLRGVAIEEMSILHHVPRRSGFVAVNIDSREAREQLASPAVTVATFGRCEDADLRVTAADYHEPWLHFEVNGRFAYRLPMAGSHNALNAAGAIVIARRLGFDHDEIAARLESFTPPPLRAQIERVAGVTLINDAYNSNPNSAVAAIETLESLPCAGRRIAVFGEMCELGPAAARLHGEVAQRLLKANVANVVLVGAAGELMHDSLHDAGGGLFAPRVEQAPDVNGALEALVDLVRPGDVVLLKASRAVGLDALAGLLRRRLESTATV